MTLGFKNAVIPKGDDVLGRTGFFVSTVAIFSCGSARNCEGVVGFLGSYILSRDTNSIYSTNFREINKK